MDPSNAHRDRSTFAPRLTSQSAPVADGHYTPSPNHAPSYSHAKYRQQRYQSTYQHYEQGHVHNHDRYCDRYADNECSNDPSRCSNWSNRRRGNNHLHNKTNDPVAGLRRDEFYLPSPDNVADDQVPGNDYGVVQQNDIYTTYNYHTIRHRDRIRDRHREDHDVRRDQDREKRNHEQEESKRQHEKDLWEEQRQEVKTLQKEAYDSALIQNQLLQERRILWHRVLAHEARLEYMKCCIDTKDNEIHLACYQRDVAQGTVEKLRNQNTSFMKLIQKQDKRITSLREQRRKLLHLGTIETKANQMHITQLKDLLGLKKAESFNIMCSKLEKKHEDILKASKVETMELKAKYKFEMVDMKRVNDEKLRKLQCKMSTKDQKLRTLVDEHYSLMTKFKEFEDNQSQQELHEKTAQECDSMKKRLARVNHYFAGAKQERDSYKQQNYFLKEKLRMLIEQVRETKEYKEDMTTINGGTHREAPKVKLPTTRTGPQPKNAEKSAKSSDEGRTEIYIKNRRVSNEELNQSQCRGFTLSKIDKYPLRADRTEYMPVLNFAPLPATVTKSTSRILDANIKDVLVTTEDILKRGADLYHDKKGNEMGHDSTCRDNIHVARAKSGVSLDSNGQSEEVENVNDGNSDRIVEKQKNVSKDTWYDQYIHGDSLDKISITCRKRQHGSVCDHYSGGDDYDDQDCREPANKTSKKAVAEQADVHKTLLESEGSFDARIGNGAAVAVSNKGNVSSAPIDAKDSGGTSAIQKHGGTSTSSYGTDLEKSN